MGSLTLRRTLRVLQHSEDESELHHPLVMILNFIGATWFAYQGLEHSSATPGQIALYTVLVCLYMCSFVQHAVHKNKHVHFCDQTLIGWSIAVIHLPFTHHETWAWALFVITAVALTVYKWFEGIQKNDWLAKLVFLGLGVISFLVMLFAGLPAMDADLTDPRAHMLGIAKLCFVAALLVYSFMKENKRPGIYWDRAETKHALLLVAFELCSRVTIANPV